MPFFLDGNPTQEEVSEAINYLLGNTQQTTSTNVVTGQVTDATGSIVSYLYKYLDVKYADSFDGTVNFTNTPTSRLYYGLRNNDSSIESTDPTDYIWYQVTGGFGTSKLLYYSVTGGRRINIVVSLSAPSGAYQPDTGPAIDLDQISGSSGNSSRICYAKSTSTSLSSIPATYQTSGPSSFPPTNTWGGGETWQATPYSLAVNEALFQSDGIYNPTTDLTTWNSPYLSTLKVGSLSAISANLGSITAGTLNAVNITGSDLSIGSSPAISGTSMTGTGSHIYSNGRMVVGNSTNSMVFDGTSLTINGNIVGYGNINGTAIGQIIAGSFNMQIITSTGVTSFTVPTNVYKLKITLIGGGGGGGTGASGSGVFGGGGGAGAGAIRIIAVNPGDSCYITIGSGGAAGSNGGLSQFNLFATTYITCNGGTAGGYSGGSGFPGSGGSASGGNVNLSGSGGNGIYGGSAPFIGTSASNGISASTNSGGGGGGGLSGILSAGSGGAGICFIEY
jgi:hypothetical protein